MRQRTLIAAFIVGSIIIGIGAVVEGAALFAVLGIFLTMGWYGLKIKNSLSEESADSLYYLGFLFTLVALIAALLSFDGSKEEPAIVNAFGLAMLSTVIGLVGRVLLTPAGSTDDSLDPESASDASSQGLQKFRWEVAETMRALADARRESAQQQVRFFEDREKEIEQEFAKATHSIGSVTTTARTVIEKTAGDARAEIQSAVDESAKRIQTAFDGIGENIEGALKRSAEAADKAAEAVDRLSKRLDETGEAWTTSVSKVSESVALSAKMLEREFGQSAQASAKSIAEATGGIVNELRSAQAELESFDFASINETLADGQKKLQESIGSSTRKLADAGDDASTRIDQASQRLTASLDSFAESAENAAAGASLRQFNTAAADAASGAGALSGAVRGIGDAAARLENQLAATTANAVAVAEGAARAVESLASQEKALRQTQQALGDSNRAMVEQLVAAQAALGRVMGTLKDGVDELRTQIRKEGNRR